MLTPRSRSRALVLAAVVAAQAVGVAEAGLPFFHRREGTPPPGRPRAFEHTDHRAGHPSQVAPHARPTHTPAYGGYYVGGGTAYGGEPRRVEEGTWGRDYRGVHLPRNVRLRWSHGARYQGGTGAYDTDGPHVPDVIGFSVSRLRNR